MRINIVFFATFFLAIFFIYLNNAIPEKHFVVIICSYNNSQWYQNNLDAVFNQDYSNYRVIYVDDCSSDNTGNLVQHYIKEKNQNHRCKIILNKKRKLKMQNMYEVIHQHCKDNEIVVEYDGDDWFAHNQALTRINKEYSNPEIWITYSQHQYWPSDSLGWGKSVPKEVIEQKKFRKFKGFLSQIRTFYAWLFKKIKKQDLLCTYRNFYGKFYPTNADVAMMFPMLEMAGDRFSFIPEVLYIYNTGTPLNDIKTKCDLAKICGREIRRRRPYERIKQIPNNIQYILKN